MKQLPCAVCGKVLKVHDNARDDRSCSLLCRMIAGGELRRDAANRLPSEPCAACSKPVKMNRNFEQPRYCDAVCSRKAAQNRKMGRPEDAQSLIKPNHKKRLRKAVSFWLPPHGIGTCAWCGDWFGRKQPTQRTCGKKCYKRLQYQVAAKYRSDYRKCSECGEEFQTTMKRRKYCGKAVCKARGRPWSPDGWKSGVASTTRYIKLRRAAVEVGDRTLTTLTIYLKAGGLCASCGTETLHPQTPRADRPRERFNWATLDHIIPLSQGGPHEWANAQLLCLSCNSRKSHSDRKRVLVQAF